jgi:hypothetical protein
MSTSNGCTAWATFDDLPVEVAPLYQPEDWQPHLDIATDILWSLSGRRWSGPPAAATAVLRAATPRMGEPGWPYHRSWGQCACYLGTAILGPLWSLDVHNHHEPVSVRLPHDDVTTVLTVTVDGGVFTGWQLDGSWLTRTDGRGWPACHDRAVVTYLHGRLPPAGGVAACVALAVEFGRAGSSNPDKACSLPQRLQSVTRQGVSYVALDDLSFLDKGLTGYYPVDVWLRSINPKGRAQAARVWSPSLPRARRA